MTANNHLHNGMNNFLGDISSDFIKVNSLLQNSAYELKRRGYDHPIFVICKNDLQYLPTLINKGEYDNKWIYHATYLESLIEKKIIEKGEVFKANYKNIDEFCCLMVIDLEFNGVIYMPYPADGE